jgi:hypothetical protein
MWLEIDPYKSSNFSHAELVPEILVVVVAAGTGKISEKLRHRVAPGLIPFFIPFFIQNNGPPQKYMHMLSWFKHILLVNLSLTISLKIKFNFW